MAGYVVSDSELESVADAIRTKGGTSAQLEWPEDFVDAIDAISTGVNNIVTGSFTGTTAGAMDVSLQYTGSGYPIAVYAWVKDGPGNTSSSFYTTISRYAVNITAFVKCFPSTTPTYTGSGDGNKAFRLLSYKNNSSGTTTYSQSNNAAVYAFNNTNASASNNDHLKIRSNKKMSVYIVNAGSYGFQKSIEYSYVVIYSS